MKKVVRDSSNNLKLVHENCHDFKPEDALHNIMASVIEKTQEQLRFLGLSDKFDQVPNGTILGPSAGGHGEDACASSVDDCVYYIQDPCPSALVSKSKLMATAVFDIFASYGLVLNFKVNKTNFLYSLVGKGCKNVKKSILENESPSISVSSSAYGPVDVPVVIKYKHVGSVEGPMLGNQLETLQ